MPKNYPDLKLLDQMAHLAFTLHESVDLAHAHLADAVDTTADVGSPHNYPTFVPSDVKVAAQEEARARQRLHQFDKQLAKLITLRGQLADVTGIPMFSHIGEDARYPDLEAYDM